MSQKPITIEDIDILFNGDKRGRQMFIIMTNGLRNFDYNNLLQSNNIGEDALKEYYNIRIALHNDPEYKEVLHSFLNNMRIALTDTPNSYTDELTKNFYSDLNFNNNTPLLTDGKLITIANIHEFINSIARYLQKLDASKFSNTIIDGRNKPDHIKALNEYIADKLKKAWVSYSNKKPTYNKDDIKKTLDYSKDITPVRPPFDMVSEEKIIVLENKFHKINKKGEIEQFSEDKVKCSSYGFNGDKKCDALLYQCLVHPSADNLSQCITTITDMMKHDDIRNVNDINKDNLKNMNPEIVLALLHRFGFKAITGADGKKQIMSIMAWKSKILPELKLNNKFDDGKSINIVIYLQHLVNYINSKPEILNGNSFTTNDFYDAKTHKDKFGNSVDKATTKKSALEGLTRFYETHKFYRADQNNFGSFMGDLYDRYDMPRPSYLQGQFGGASSYELLKANMDSGNSGVKYLTTIYNALKSSLSNVEIHEVDDEMKNYLAHIKKDEDKILEYLKFLDKVTNIYHLFKYAPTQVKFGAKDIADLEKELDNKVKIYQDKESKVAKFIEALAKKELHPFSENSVFSIDN
jgi:hypothetical protein